MNQQRKKNKELVNDLESELNKSKQLEKELEENITNVQGQSLENEYQEIYYKIKNLQQKYQEEIDMNGEIQENDNNEEEKKAADNSITSYNNNGFFNTLEIERNKFNNLNEVLEREKKINQCIEKIVNEKDLNMNNLHGYIIEEKKLYNELRQIWKNLKEKNKNLIII